MKIYLVKAYQGMYSDRSEWVHSAWTTQEAAETESRRLSDEFRKIFDIDTFDLVYDEEQKLHERKLSLDKHVTEYQMEPPKYSVEEITLQVPSSKG